MRKVLFVIIAVLLAAALPACSGNGAVMPDDKAAKSEPAAKTSKPVTVEESKVPEAGTLIEPEQLISKDEAAAIVGDVKEGKKTEQPAVGQKIMFYETADGEGFLQISLNQLAFMSVEGNTPESIYMPIKDAVASEDAETAQGVGDEYFFGTPGLHILYKGYYICLGAGNSDDPAVREILKQAGAKAISNLDALLG